MYRRLLSSVLCISRGNLHTDNQKLPITLSSTIVVEARESIPEQPPLMNKPASGSHVPRGDPESLGRSIDAAMEVCNWMLALAHRCWWCDGNDGSPGASNLEAELLLAAIPCCRTCDLDEEVKTGAVRLATMHADCLLLLDALVFCHVIDFRSFLKG